MSLNQRELHIKPEHLRIVSSILEKNLTRPSVVWVFGSRARGNTKTYSDLDLAIDLDGKQISMAIMAALSADFEESDLPYKVDIVDWNSIDNSFKAAIEREVIKLVF